jgi:hypothetical protein
MSTNLLAGPSRLNNPVFSELNWRTDVLFTKDGLTTVKQLVPVLGVLFPQVAQGSDRLLIVLQDFIDAVTEWESRKTHASAQAKQSHQIVLKHLRSTFVDSSPKDCKDAFYCTLFSYQLIDVIAYHKRIGQVARGRERTTVPFSSHLVRLMVDIRHIL